MSDFGNSSWPVGRKDYKREWCGEPIPKGEKHYHYVGVWEGDWQNWRMHQECQEDADQSEADVDGFSPFEHERPAKVSA